MATNRAPLTQRAAGQVARQATNQGEPTLPQMIRSMEEQFQLAMPRGAEASQLVRDALTVLKNTPKLAEVDVQSLLGALMTCAQLGLRPGVGALGHAYVIPFKGKATLIIGYQGMIELANRSGDIASITAREVHENDTFDIEYGLNETLVHKPAMRGPRGPVTGYYATFKRPNGGYGFSYATVDEIKAHRDKYALQKDRQGNIKGPWVDHFDAMALKTVLRDLWKFMPRDTTIQSAIVADTTQRVDYAPDSDLAESSVYVGQVVDEDDEQTPDADGVIPDVAPPADPPLDYQGEEPPYDPTGGDYAEPPADR